MPEASGMEKLQPALLDRLVDDAPSEVSETRDRRVISLRQLREALHRDLVWLFNCKCLPPNDTIWKYPLVSRSVLNFGMPDLTGLPTSTQRGRQVQTAMRAAVEAFEPRIMATTLDVRTTIDERPSALGRMYVTELSGEACPVPVPEPLLVRAEVDLENGEYRLRI